MDIRHSVLFAACVAAGSVAVPAMSLDEYKAAYACAALVIDPSSAINLRRPPALRYKAAPVRICVRDDSDRSRLAAFM
jgi:hypothetical protein